MAFDFFFFFVPPALKPGLQHNVQKTISSSNVKDENVLRRSEQSDTQTSHRLYAHLKLPWIICAGWSEVSSVLALQQCLDRIYESLVRRFFFFFRLLIVIMGQLNSSLLPTVTHAIKPSPLIFFFFLPTMPVNTQMEAHIHASYLQRGGEKKNNNPVYSHMPAPSTHNAIV